MTSLTRNRPQNPLVWTPGAEAAPLVQRDLSRDRTVDRTLQIALLPFWWKLRPAEPLPDTDTSH